MSSEMKVYVGKKGAQTLYKRLKDLIGRITTYQKVTNTTESGVPIVTDPNSRTIYLVKDNTVVGDDTYKEWIWTSDLGWECIGTTTIPENAWKQWAEDNGSVGTIDTVYLGKNNNLARTWTFGFGNNNISSSTLDNVDWSGSDVVMIGSFNSAIDAAGAYQVGFRNSVVNNHRMSESLQSYNYYTAINVGHGNEIDAEGMNLGKNNTAADFGMNIGQHNTANRASISIGERVATDHASISIGTDSIAENKSLSIGFGNVVAGVLYEDGELLHSYEYGGSIAIGINHLCAAKNSFVIGSGTNSADTYSVVSDASFAILAEGIELAQDASNIYGNSFGVGSCLNLTDASFSIGRFNTASNHSYAIGEKNGVNCGSFAIGQNNTLIGDPNATNSAMGHAFATGRDLNDIHGNSCTFGIGNTHIREFAYSSGINNNNIYKNAVAIGNQNNNVYERAIAVGLLNTEINGDAMAIGIDNHGISSTGIVFGCYNFSVYGGSFAAGKANTAQNGSISVGIGNLGRAGAMLFGMGNKAISASNDSYYDSYHANSVIMGFGNEAYNVREYLHKSGWTSPITTCGLVIGAYIKAYGHNFISFGSSNTLGDTNNWMNDTVTDTDNDGFMTAIGFMCTAKRNYDFAYGYQSTASGGENIAFQHSSATGYRNVAMVDSTINGTGNIGIMESSMHINMASGYDATNTLTHNILLNARLSSPQDCAANYGYHHNIMASTSVSLYGSTGAVGNIIFGGRNRTYNGEYNPIKFYSTNSAITGNVVLGNMSAGTTINSDDGARNNFIFNPEQMSITSTNAVACNTFLNGYLGLNKSDAVMYNFVHNSSIVGTVGPLTNNILFGNSRLQSSVYDNTYGMFKNVLFCNSKLTHTNADSAWSGSLMPSGENFLFGTQAEDTLACVSFGDRALDDTWATPTLTNCLRVFNFGDNTIQRSIKSEVFGNNNTLTSVTNSFVVGDKNVLSGQPSVRVDQYLGIIGRVNIFGNENKLYTASNTSIERLMMRGCYNEVHTNCYDLSMFGNNNRILASELTITIVDTITELNHSINASVLTRIHTTTSMPLPIIESTSTEGSSIYSGWYILYAYGMLYVTWTAPSNYISITGSSLASQYQSGILQENTWYKLSSTYTLGSSETITFGELSSTDSNVNYIVGKGKAAKDSLTYGNDRDFIAGDRNNIYAGINDCVVFGNDNNIFSDYGNHDHDFIQGNNNTINDGSGSVIIGSGSTANGHMAIAIGNQLEANQWQTVIGKYNSPIDGPDRLTEPDSEPTKALFIVGNGYSETDGSNWQSDDLIHRSNALELYADGRLKISGKIEATNIPPAPDADGQYTLTCEVISGVSTYRWVANS